MYRMNMYYDATSGKQKHKSTIKLKYINKTDIENVNMKLPRLYLLIFFHCERVSHGLDV
jgi:hypothetical protein